LGQCIIISGSTPISSAIDISNWSYDGKFIQLLNILGLTAGQTYSFTVIVS
jgi:hypothetical protein